MSVGSFVVDTMSIEVETPILASPERVYAAITEHVAQWWGSPYLHRDDATALYLDPSIGGDFWEEWPDGGGALWGRVVCLQPGALVAIDGPMGMPGPVTSMVRMTLKAHGGSDYDGAGAAEDLATIVRVTHRAFGRLTVDMKQEYAIGWDDLIRLRLKPFVEQDVRHGLGHSMPPEAQARLQEHDE